MLLSIKRKNNEVSFERKAEGTVFVNCPLSLMKKMIKTFKEDWRLSMKVMEITGIDYPEKKNRFELRYILLSYNHNQRIIMKTSVDEKTGVESISSIMESAN
mmetsp:Transcript_19648/g.46907  ORF Transcript_19648/g.46907 Transcript_19648/m.46907 type:complete len:102 (-) Transcript_19648:722-1027(-)